MRASLEQTSLEPGSTAHMRAVLTEYGLPVDGRATVRAEVSGPVAATVGLAWVGSGGRYEGDLPLPLPGTYHVRVVAEGLTMRGAPFTREQSFTAVALPGGDNPPPGPSGDDGLCDLLTCLTKVSAKALERNGINPEEVLRCVQQHCAHEEVGVPR